MRSVTTLAGLLALVVAGAACSVNVSTDGSGGSTPNNNRANAARRAPPPPPPPPPRNNAPAPPPPPPAAPAPAPAPPPAPAQPGALQPMKALAGSINLMKVQEIKKRNPKACGYMEVSPNNWVHIDCGKYTASTKAVPHFSPRKSRLVRAHKTLFKPLKIAVKAGPRAGMNLGGGSGGGGGGAPSVNAAGTPFGGPNQTAEAFPNSVDHRTDNTEGPVKNQGGVGSCTAHSLSSTLDNAAIRAGVMKADDSARMSSPLHVWSRYGLPNMGAAADGNIAQPVAIFTTWPQKDSEACELFQGGGEYADDCSQSYGVKAGAWRSNPTLMAKYNKSQGEGIYKIAAIEKLEVGPPNMEELLTILASGADIWSAFLIDGYAWSNKKMTNAVIPNWSDYNGGHAVVISGYRDTPSGKQFLIHNSWGESWGDKGYAWINDEMVNKWLYYAYKVKITNGVPKDQLTDDDCAPDELVDLTTGICAIMCDKGDGRPNNGCPK